MEFQGASISTLILLNPNLDIIIAKSTKLDELRGLWATYT